EGNKCDDRLGNSGLDSRVEFAWYGRFPTCFTRDLFRNRYGLPGFLDCCICLVLTPMVGCNILYLFFFFLMHLALEAHDC
ncbi:hypothetical protein VIGAN_04435400, partial [Vigna angularis var. angularis]